MLNLIKSFIFRLDASKTRSASFLSVFSIAALFTYLGHLNAFSTLANLPSGLFTKGGGTELIFSIFWVQFVGLPWIGMYIRAKNEAKFLVHVVKGRLATLVGLFLTSFLAMSSLYFLRADDMPKAFLHLYSVWLEDEPYFLALLFLFVAGLPSMVLKGLVDSGTVKAKLEAFGSIFFLSPIWLWVLFVFLDFKAGYPKNYLADHPGIDFNFYAWNFSTYSMYAAMILLGYLLTIRFHKDTRAAYLSECPDEDKTDITPRDKIPTRSIDNGELDA